MGKNTPNNQVGVEGGGTDSLRVLSGAVLLLCDLFRVATRSGVKHPESEQRER